MAETSLQLRDYRPGDAGPLSELFRAAVHESAASHYSAAQREAWAPEDLQASDWEPRLSTQHTLVADISGRPAGFIAWSDDGLVDLLFTAPPFGRRGIASLLCREAEARMRARGVPEARTFASHLSRPVFERNGWRVIRSEQVDLQGVALERFEMRKSLG